jgi:hypothetical protein
MGARRSADGAAVKEPATERPRWLLVRQGPLAPEERAVLEAVHRRLSAQGREFVTVLLGSSSYDAELPTPRTDDLGDGWLLEDDARGRGVRRPAGRSGRTVTADELVAAIMAAEKVIQFP